MMSPGCTWKNAAWLPSSAAAARASIVLPHPGGPYSRRPRIWPRTPVKRLTSAMAGHSKASFKAAFAPSRPMMSAKLSRPMSLLVSTRVRCNSSFAFCSAASSLPSPSPDDFSEASVGFLEPFTLGVLAAAMLLLLQLPEELTELCSAVSPPVEASLCLSCLSSLSNCAVKLLCNLSSCCNPSTSMPSFESPVGWSVDRA
mmetsp:Transcript_34435/g.78502  ORF Transcript_34435/g.78502 Transcript_34435/m.78502 type:complete len:200 (+) Transcript_34435:676-1275(+)